MVLLIILVKFLVLLTFCDAMTMKQIKNTGKTLRKACIPKTNVEEEKIDKISEGVFNEEKEVMCYMACIMKMANTFKNGRFNFDSAMKQADMLLPEEIKEPAKVVLTACKKVHVIYDNDKFETANRDVTLPEIPQHKIKLAEPYKDPCEGAFHLGKCLYKENPGIFYFP